MVHDLASGAMRLALVLVALGKGFTGNASGTWVETAWGNHGDAALNPMRKEQDAARDVEVRGAQDLGAPSNYGSNKV